MTTSRRFIASLGAIATLVLTSTSPAITIYSNGSDAHGGGDNPFSYNDVFVAQDFIVGSPASLSSVIFNAYTTSSTLPITGVQVKIYSDNSGSVGSQLYSGNFGLNNQTFTETWSGYNLYDFEVLLPSWSLAAGNYWLALQVDPAQFDMHWSIPTSGPTGNYGSYIGDNAGTPASYQSYSYEHVFRLESDSSTAVPDAGSTAAFLALGFAGLVSLGRKTR